MDNELLARVGGWINPKPPSYVAVSVGEGVVVGDLVGVSETVGV
jgi:hypothetical protein